MKRVIIRENLIQKWDYSKKCRITEAAEQLKLDFAEEI